MNAVDFHAIFLSLLFFPHLVDLQMTLAQPATKSCIERRPNGNVNALPQQEKKEREDKLQ